MRNILRKFAKKANLIHLFIVGIWCEFKKKKKNSRLNTYVVYFSFLSFQTPRLVVTLWIRIRNLFWQKNKKNGNIHYSVTKRVAGNWTVNCEHHQRELWCSIFIWRTFFVSKDFRKMFRMWKWCRFLCFFFLTTMQNAVRNNWLCTKQNDGDTKLCMIIRGIIKCS